MENFRTRSCEGHRDRLRQRFLRAGLDGFHDYEVIELLLTLATPRKDCKAAAKSVMEKFRTLPAALEASSEALMAVEGIGARNVLGIKLIKAVADRYLEHRLLGQNPIVGNSRQLFDYLYLRLRDRKRECFKVLFLNAKNQVIAAKVLFEGTLTASCVYPREVVQTALDHHAAALICVHNHPSGDPAPSAEDIAVTRQLIFACRVMDIVVHEHIIIGNNRYFSFADQGMIRKIHLEYEQHPGSGQPPEDKSP